MAQEDCHTMLGSLLMQASNPQRPPPLGYTVQLGNVAGIRGTNGVPIRVGQVVLKVDQLVWFHSHRHGIGGSPCRPRQCQCCFSRHPCNHSPSWCPSRQSYKLWASAMEHTKLPWIFLDKLPTKAASLAFVSTCNSIVEAFSSCIDQATHSTELFLQINNIHSSNSLQTKLHQEDAWSPYTLTATQPLHQCNKQTYATCFANHCSGWI